jgi:hypothetical protein
MIMFVSLKFFDMLYSKVGPGAESKFNMDWEALYLWSKEILNFYCTVHRISKYEVNIPVFH